MSSISSAIEFARFLKRWAGAELGSRIPGGRTTSGNEAAGGSKRALIVAPFPPPVSGGVYRPVSWTKYGADHGWEPHVLSYDNGKEIGDAENVLLSEVAKGVSVTRLSPRTELFWPVARRLSVGGDFNEALYWQHAIVADKSRGDYRAVIASGPPFSTFVAGYYISRRLKLPLVLDYRDEWSESPFEFVINTPFGRKWEERCLAHASRVIYTTQSQKERALGAFGGDLGEKSVVIPNGWDDSHRPVPSEEATHSAGGPFEILFAGAIGTHTPFGLFLDAFSEYVAADPARKSSVRLSILGNQSADAMKEIQKSPLADLISFEPQVAVTEVIGRLNRSGAALLIVSEDFERYIPGKVYYYMACERPILVYGATGEAQRIVEDSGAGTFVPQGDSAALASAMNELTAGDAARWNTQTRQDWTARYTRQNAAGAMYTLLDELVAGA